MLAIGNGHAEKPKPEEHRLELALLGSGQYTLAEWEHGRAQNEAKGHYSLRDGRLSLEQPDWTLLVNDDLRPTVYCLDGAIAESKTEGVTGRHVIVEVVRRGKPIAKGQRALVVLEAGRYELQSPVGGPKHIGGFRLEDDLLTLKPDDEKAPESSMLFFRRDGYLHLCRTAYRSN